MLDWKKRAYAPIKKPTKFWNVNVPADAREFLGSLDQNGEPIDGIRFEDGSVHSLESLTDAEAVEWANKIVDVVQKLPGVRKVAAPSTLKPEGNASLITEPKPVA